MLLCVTAPAAAATDPTRTLLDELNNCDAQVASLTGPPLDVLIALANGRSAYELKDVLAAPTRCTGHVFAVGQGADEIVLVGSPRTGDTVGAVLWVDRGWWRIAAARIGYAPYPLLDMRRDGARELVIGVASGGSAGDIGLVGLRLARSVMTTILRLPPGTAGEISHAHAIDDDHILVEGRVPAPLVTWNSHAGWPGGAQWLFERRGSAFVEVARRQTRDPEYVASGFIGGLIARDASAMARFATPSAVAAALSLPGPARYNGAVGVFGGPGLIDRERMSWTALPASVRADPPAGPAWGPLPVFEGPPELADVVLRFDRRDDGWVITEVAMRPVPAAGEAFLVPD